MASSVIGTVTLNSGTGSKTVNLGTTTTPYEIDVTIGAIGSGSDSYFHFSDGVYANGYNYCFTSNSSSITQAQPSKVFSVKDNTGAVVFEGQVSSVGSGSVTFNVTTASLSINPQMLIVARFA